MYLILNTILLLASVVLPAFLKLRTCICVLKKWALKKNPVQVAEIGRCCLENIFLSQLITGHKLTIAVQGIKVLLGDFLLTWGFRGYMLFWDFFHVWLWERIYSTGRKEKFESDWRQIQMYWNMHCIVFRVTEYKLDLIQVSGLFNFWHCSWVAF